MNTKLLSINDESLLLAGRIIRDGGLVAFPTETVYGLGANALNAEAVRGIFEAKGRPQDNPLIVHVSTRDMIDPLCEVTPTAEKLMVAFFPGPLTLLLPKKSIVPDVTTAGLDTVGIRMPEKKEARDFIAACGVPIAAPSANLSGRPSPTTAQHVYADMQGRIPLILDGGPCRVGVESTVLDLSGPIPRVLRPGEITAQDVARVCGSADVADSVMRPLKEGEAAPSPGMKHRHYAPKGRMTVYIGSPEDMAAAIRTEYEKCARAGESCRVFCLDTNRPLYAGMDTCSLGRDCADAANRLFELLRRMDDENVTRILSEGFKPEGEALAVMNRMARAAAFDLIEV